MTQVFLKGMPPYMERQKEELKKRAADRPGRITVVDATPRNRVKANQEFSKVIKTIVALDPTDAGDARLLKEYLLFSLFFMKDIQDAAN